MADDIQRINGKDFFRCPKCNLFHPLHNIERVKVVDILTKTFQVIGMCKKCKTSCLRDTKQKLDKMKP